MITLITIYIVIGMVIYYFQQDYIKEEFDFYEMINDYQYLLFVVKSIVMWLPDLLEFIFKKQ